MSAFSMRSTPSFIPETNPYKKYKQKIKQKKEYESNSTTENKNIEYSNFEIPQKYLEPHDKVYYFPSVKITKEFPVELPAKDIQHKSILFSVPEYEKECIVYDQVTERWLMVKESEMYKYN